MAAAVRALIGWFGGESALATLVSVLLAVGALVFGLIYRRYLLLLGADRRKPAERQAYDALRASLAEGNLAARLYADRLTQFLDWIDRFFGDAGMADRTLFPHAFGLRAPRPLWTAPAFDRCLALALVYPILTIVVIWAVSGRIGPAESALRFTSDLSVWQRTATGMGFAVVLFVLATKPKGEEPRLRLGLIWMIFGFAVVFAIDLRVAFIVMVLVCASPNDIFGSGSGVGCVLGAVTLSVLLGVNVYSSDDVHPPLIVGIATFLMFFAISRVGQRAIGRRWRGAFLSVFLVAMILTCFAYSILLSSFQAWEETGPLLLIIGLLTLLNAPFDWASLGLTRALLRRGLELGGWWPYALALVDASLAAVVIAALALTMVIGVQAFDTLAVYGGGAPVLPLERLFNGIAAQPSAPEYWWLYALLLSTMIPSLINLIMGGTSLVRGVPGLPSLLLRKIPERGNVPKFDRAWIATVLTSQVALGAALGIIAQVFLVWVIIGQVMPFFGLELLDMARDVAAFNLPARVGQLFGVNL